MYANDGTADSEPLSFTITVHHDASPQFHHAGTYQERQRWTRGRVIEVYEGPQANAELGRVILGSYDGDGNPVNGLPARIETTSDMLQIPWTASRAGTRTWTLGNRDGAENGPKIQCKDQNGLTTHTWADPGSEDSLQVTIHPPPGDSLGGHIPLRFASVPDFEDPKDHNQDNEYLIRLVGSHDIHGLGSKTETPGCNGSALDLKIRVKDVGPPAPVQGLILTPQTRDDTKFNISWTSPHANQFIEGTERVDFPHESFNISQMQVSHEPPGLIFPWSVTASPFHFGDHITGIQNIRGIPGATYTITARLLNSEGLSEPVSQTITIPGPPDQPAETDSLRRRTHLAGGELDGPGRQRPGDHRVFPAVQGETGTTSLEGLGHPGNLDRRNHHNAQTGHRLRGAGAGHERQGKQPMVAGRSGKHRGLQRHHRLPVPKRHEGQPGFRRTPGHRPRRRRRNPHVHVQD